MTYAELPARDEVVAAAAKGEVERQRRSEQERHRPAIEQCPALGAPPRGAPGPIRRLADALPRVLSVEDSLHFRGYRHVTSAVRV